MRFASFVVTFAMLACNKERGGDCTKLVQAAGPLHSTLSTNFGNSSQTPEQLEAEAVSYEKGAADLNALDLKDDAVKGIASDFATMLTKAAKIRRDQAAAAGSLDPTAAGTAQAAATGFMVEEMRVKARLDTQCR